MSVDRQTSALAIGDIILNGELRGTVPLHPQADFPVLGRKHVTVVSAGAATAAINLAALATHVILAGLTGTDEEGIIIKSKMSECDVDTKGLLFTHNRPTARMTYVVDSNHSNRPHLRIGRQSTDTLSLRAETDLLQIDVPLFGAVDRYRVGGI
jgi:bifunctional ADP-heptose synthase (sugar kinase/adenylyltransferase)